MGERTKDELPDPLPLQSAGEEVLLRLAHSGSDIAFERLYERAKPRLLGRLVGILRDHHEAEDVFHDTMLTTLEKWKDYEPEKGSFVDWANGIARRKALAHLRKRGAGFFPPDTVTKLADALIRLADEDQRSHGRFTLPTIVSALPVRQRELLYLRYVLDYTATEVAELWGKKPGTVREMERYALNRLRPRFLPPDADAQERSTEGVDRHSMVFAPTFSRVIAARRAFAY